MRPRGSSTTSVPRRPSPKKLNRVRVLTGTDAHIVADADAGADMGPDVAAVAVQGAKPRDLAKRDFTGRTQEDSNLQPPVP